MFTITNVPTRIVLPEGVDPYPLLNKSLPEMLVPRYAVSTVPEMAFILRRKTATDGLLSRLNIPRKSLMPVRVRDGWVLPDDIRNSWRRLEQGLMHVSMLLILRANTPASMTISGKEFWHTPTEQGYLRVHRISQDALYAAIRSRDAMFLLAARCSLAIALWLPPSNKPSEGCVPTWVSFLALEGVHHSWIDALLQSAISQFDPQSRVGTLIDYHYCQWPLLIPTLLTAQVPIIFKWPSPEAVEPMCKQFPFLQPLSPTPRDALSAFNTPPHGQDNTIFTLWRQGFQRTVPSPPRTSTQALPPCGPFQKPGETRQQWVERMTNVTRATANRQTQTEREARIARYTEYTTTKLPLPGTRAYLWVKVGDILPDVPEAWQTLEYREPIPRRALPGLLLGAHGQRIQQVYNPVFDCLDLWTLEDTSNTELPDDSADVLSHEVEDEGQEQPTEPDFDTTTLEEERSFHQALLTGEYEVDFPPTWLPSWYGLHPVPCDDQTPEYGRFPSKHLHTVFGQLQNKIPSDVSLRQSMSGWAWCLFKEVYDCPTMRLCWDLNEHHPCYLLHTMPRGLQVQGHTAPTGAARKLYTVRYPSDPPSQSWSLLLHAVTLLHLLRINSVRSSTEAIHHLLSVGASFNTIMKCPVDVQPTTYQPAYFPPFYRPQTHRPNAADYEEQRPYIMGLLHKPHARSALMKGGITWRLMMEVMSQSEGLWDFMVEQICSGPSLQCDTPLRTHGQQRDSAEFVDDDLAMEELDLISGVYKVYTGMYQLLYY